MNRSYKKYLSRKIRSTNKQVERFKRKVGMLEIEMACTNRMGALSSDVYMTKLTTELGNAKHALVGAIMHREWQIAGLRSLKNAKLHPPTTKEDQARRMLRKSLYFGINYSTQGSQTVEVNLTPSVELDFPILDYPSKL